MDDPTTAGQFEPTSRQDAEPGQAEQTGDYEICIRVGADGQLSVGVETGEAAPAAPGAQGTMPAEAESGYSQVGSIKEALTTALEIYRANGKAPGAEDLGDTDFKSGLRGG